LFEKYFENNTRCGKKIHPKTFGKKKDKDKEIKIQKQKCLI
jgi:hypothetical protein